MPPPLLGCLRRCFELDNALRPVMAELLKGCNESASWLNAELPLVSKSAKASSSREDLVDSLYTVARVLLATKGRRDAAIDALKDVIALAPDHPDATKKLEMLSTETTEAPEDDIALSWTKFQNGISGAGMISSLYGLLTQRAGMTLEEETDAIRQKFGDYLGAQDPIEFHAMAEDRDLRFRSIDKFCALFTDFRTKYPGFPAEAVEWKVDYVVHLMKYADTESLYPMLQDEVSHLHSRCVSYAHGGWGHGVVRRNARERERETPGRCLAPSALVIAHHFGTRLRSMPPRFEPPRIGLAVASRRAHRAGRSSCVPRVALSICAPLLLFCVMLTPLLSSHRNLCPLRVRTRRSSS